MTMRDQILTGITNALNNSAPDSTLALLSSDDYMTLTDSILRELATLPADTPAPTITTTPAAPALVITPADVIANAAQNALDDVTEHLAHYDATGADAEVDCWGGGEDYKATREFLFRIQAMFGIRIRSTRTGSFLVAGHRDQIRSLQRTMMLMRNLADDTLARLDADEQAEFWATLGDLCIDDDAAQSLIDANEANSRNAAAALVREYGPARTLTRTEAVTSGAVFDLARSVLTQSQS